MTVLDKSGWLTIIPINRSHVDSTKRRTCDGERNRYCLVDIMAAATKALGMTVMIIKMVAVTART